MRLLYIGTDIYKVDSGASHVNLRNLSILKARFGNDFVSLAPQHCKTFCGFLNWGGDKVFLSRLQNVLQNQHFDYIFLSQSLLGTVAKKIKSIYPQIRIICFFHNIEVQYAKEYVRTSGILHLPFYFSAKSAEAKVVEYSDYYIVLNERDGFCLKDIYAKQVSLILPISFEDKYDESKVNKKILQTELDIIYLFVGVAFFANVQGILWFINNVLPYIPGRLVIVGKGMEEYEQRFKSSCERIEVYGFVDDLSFFYYKANVVVSPILSGGGMKTKTAEALMYGKTIIGTKEAFEGYVLDEKAMKLCSNAQEFIDTALCLIKNNECTVFNPYSRNLYKTFYSKEAVSDLLNIFFNKLDNSVYNARREKNSGQCLNACL